MEEIKFMAVGDISLETKNDENPFKHIQQVFDDKDLLFGNLETVLANEGKEKEKAVVLDSDPNKVKFLKNFDILNVANNHIYDLGEEGFKKTISTLNKNGIKIIGMGNQYRNNNVVNCKGIKIAFLGYPIPPYTFSLPYKPSITHIKKSDIIKKVSSIKKKVDFTIISLHWGVENVNYPSPDQIKFAHKLIEVGADMILGHHPHVLQGIEKYNGGIIAYSLGNFQFDPKVSQSIDNRSVILSLKLNKNGNISYDLIPVRIDENNCPRLLTNKEKSFDFFIKEISDKIEKGYDESFWVDRIANTYMLNNFNSFKKRIKKKGAKPLFEMLIWLLTPLCMKSYFSMIKQKIGGKY